MKLLRSPWRAVAVAWFFWVGAASAQPLSYTPIAVDSFSPAERGSDWFVLDSLDLSDEGRPRFHPSAGLTAGFAYQPVVIPSSSQPGFQGVVLGQQLALHLGASISILRRLRIGLDVPVALYNGGSAVDQSGITYPAPPVSTLGDLRLGVDVRLFGRALGAATGALGLNIWLPSGSRGDYTAAGGPLVQLHFLLGGNFGPIAWAARLALEKRGGPFSDVSYGGAHIGGELEFGLAAGVRLLHRNFLVGPELYGRTVISADRGYANLSTPIEALLGAHLRLARSYHVSLGVGRRLTDGLGAADVRVVVGFEWRYGGPAPEEQVVVMPDSEGKPIGGVEVNDGGKTVLLDKPYATAKLQEDGTVKDRIAKPEEIRKEFEKVVVALPPPPPDRDHDGIADANDACPDAPGPVSADPKRRGCPVAAERVTVLADADGHVGAVEVNDGKRTVLLDKAYATAETDPAGVTRAADPLAPADLAHIYGAATAALPPLDRDHDDVPDAQDACPDRPGVASADPARNGCPRTTERVVVLPDPDGHVGGVEVNDGKQVVVLDKAYASSEVGTDGRAREVPADSAEVTKTFAPAIQAQPTGKRLVIYFDEKAQPTQDLAPPIAQILEEIKGRDKYTIEVVGHTDSKGTATHNEKLALERAKVIGAGLVAAGVPKARVKVISKGETELAVPTADDVPEPRNRRVEVSIK